MTAGRAALLGSSMVDAVVVGAEFAGLYMLHTLRALGLTVRGFEPGGDIWPHGGVDFAGQSVAVTGTGSSGIQALAILSTASSWRPVSTP